VGDVSWNLLLAALNHIRNVV